MALKYEMFGNKMRSVALNEAGQEVAWLRRTRRPAGGGYLAGYTYRATLINGGAKLGPCEQMSALLIRIEQAL